MQQTYFKKQLVLIGGGHANVQVLRKLCMNEYKSLNVILISVGYIAIYSGMTPGYIKKLYSLDDISIDLQRLCFNAGATFIKDKVINLDNKNQILSKIENPFSRNWQNLRNYKKTFRSSDGSEIDFELYDSDIPLLVFYPSGESSGGFISIYFEEYIQKIEINSNGNITSQIINY